MHHHQLSIAAVLCCVIFNHSPAVATSSSITGRPLNQSTGNDKGLSKEKLSTIAIAEQLRNQALKIKAKYYDPKSSKLDYTRIGVSNEYKSYLTIVSGLASVDLSSLASKEEKISFWINLYNSLLIHGVIENKIKTSVLDVPYFFKKTNYTVGGLRFSLDDIEHGILRANRFENSPQKKYFSSNDPKLAFALSEKEMDPRIHFALNCGAQSCPPIAFYEAKDLEQQLDAAAKVFIQLQTKLTNGEIYASQLFEWYSKDFYPAPRAFLAKYSTGPVKEALEKNVPIKYTPYDWSLNGR